MRRFVLSIGLAVVSAVASAGPGMAKPKKAERAAQAEPAKPAEPPALTKDAVNGATFREPPAKNEDGKKNNDGKRNRAARASAETSKRPDPLLIKVQVLLDRAHFSPGAIDGRDGENLRGALEAFAVAQGLPASKSSATRSLDQATFDKLQATSAEPVLTEYTITEDDAKGPFEPIPKKLEDQAEPQSMGYTNAREMLAERFHMQRDLLSALNPDKPLDKAGTVILVASVTPTGSGKVENAPLSPKVTRVEVDKESRRVRAFADDGKLVATYPASIGSSEKPAPTGTFKITRAAFDPWYTYNPKYRFKGVKTRKKFSIRPGPNNPVGLVWIDLSIDSYGIHGTPEPENVGKTESHGCIRLTNWDARDLASHVTKGAKAEFLEK